MTHGRVGSNEKELVTTGVPKTRDFSRTLLCVLVFTQRGRSPGTPSNKEDFLHKESQRKETIQGVLCHMSHGPGRGSRFKSSFQKLIFRGNEIEPIGKGSNVFQHRGLLRRVSRE